MMHHVMKSHLPTDISQLIYDHRAGIMTLTGPSATLADSGLSHQYGKAYVLAVDWPFSLILPEDALQLGK